MMIFSGGNEIGLKWQCQSLEAAMRSVLGRSRSRSILGGSGIVEGGFDKSVSLA